MNEGADITFTVSKGVEPKPEPDPEPEKKPDPEPEKKPDPEPEKPTTVSKDVTFAVPSSFSGSVEISYIQDGAEIGHDSGSAGESFTCTVYGKTGTSSVVEAYFTQALEPDPETGETQYETKSASKTVYFE